MNRCLILSLLSFGLSLSSCSHLPPRQYYYVNLQMNWTDAQQYCKEKYTDLATIESMDDISKLQPAFSYSWAWIGLRDDPTSLPETNINPWRWSATGEPSKTGYQNWRSSPKEPTGRFGNENCVLTDNYGEWLDAPCELLRRFVCYTETNQTEKTYVLISIVKTWTDARDYCRQHHTDLATIENNEEKNQVIPVIHVSGCWIGLYRVPLTWSDQTQSSFTHWRSYPNSPNNVGGSQFCVSENTEHEWDDDDCWTEYPFICHQVTEVKTVVRMNIKTAADLTDPAVNTQILQQLEAMLTRKGLTNVSLRWKIQPKKQEVSMVIQIITKTESSIPCAIINIS